MHPSFGNTLKVHKHEIVLIFFLGLNQNLIWLWSKFSFDFCQDFDVPNIFALTEHSAEPIFCCKVSEIIFCKMFTLMVLDGILDFSKFRLFIDENCILIGVFCVFVENYSVHWLSIRGNDFIACWARWQIYSWCRWGKMIRFRWHRK